MKVAGAVKLQSSGMKSFIVKAAESFVPKNSPGTNGPDQTNMFFLVCNEINLSLMFHSQRREKITSGVMSSSPHIISWGEQENPLS